MSDRRSVPSPSTTRPGRLRHRLTAGATTLALTATLLAGAAPALADDPPTDQLAFPGAEGLGRFAAGGRGGEVYHVTSTELTGEGTLHHALTTTGDVPRTIVFDVSGTLTIPQIVVKDAANITLAGQTAPGDGVTIAGNTIRFVDSHDIVIRHLRFRMGEHPDVNDDTMYIENSQDVIIDHSSFSWGTDEVLSVKSKDYDNPTSKNITVQWSIISEGLLTHSMGGLIEMNTISMHHNLYAHNNDRNPKTKGQIDFVNNTVYNWGDFPYVAGGESGTKGYGNVVGNTFIAGVNSTDPDAAIVRGNENYQVHLDGNVLDGDQDGELDPVAGDEELLEAERPAVVVDERFAYPPVHTQDALEAHELTLEHAGASLHRDAVDERVVRSVREQSGAIIDHQDDVGGYPELTEAAPEPDTDRDGMPDRWERQHRLDPHDPADRNGDPDGDGYTHLEEYLHELAAPAAPAGYPTTPVEWSGEQFEPPEPPAEEPAPTAPLAPLDGEIIRGGVVHDSGPDGAANAAAWSVQQDLQVGDLVAGDRDTYRVAEVPEQLVGAEWIRTAVGSRSATDEDLLRFHTAADSTVYIAHDSRIEPDPAWLREGYEPTGLTLTDDQPVTWELFSREVAAGTEVVTGPNAGGSRMNYLVMVVPSAPTGTVPADPSQPPTLTLDHSSGAAQVDLAWDLVDSADAYLVQRSTAADPHWRVIGSSATGSFADTAPALGLRTDYRIVPVAAGGAASPSPSASVHPLDPSVPVPGTPTGLEVTATASYSVELAWDPVDGAEGYMVQRAAGADAEFEDLGHTTGTVLRDAEAQPGTTYRYRVAATSAGGASEPSAPVSTTTGEPMEIPSAPEGLRVTASAVDRTALAWDAVPGAQEYVVLRAIDDDPASEIARVTSPEVVDEELSTSATGYTYTVIAANERGQSPASAAVHVDALVPETPSAPRVTLRGDTFVGLTWDRGAGTGQIEVLRTIDGEDQVVATGKVNTTYVRDLEPEHEYTVRLRATNAAGASELSAPLTVTTLPERWGADAVYQRGDRVGHDGAVWEAARRTQGDRPGSSPAWTELPAT